MVGEIPFIIVNSLSPSELGAGLATTDMIDASSAAAMGATAAGRDVLAYAVGCALDATQSISFTVGGTPYTVTGSMGIASGWTAHALSATEAAWVSACVLSRVNLTSTVVSVSLRGANAGTTTTAELADYQIEEGAFWGNIFTDLGSITGYSCAGEDQVAVDSYGDLPLRACAQWDGIASSHRSPCGMSYAGLCSTVCATANPYAGCAFQAGTPSAAVVTSFLYGTPR
jgi:hypothetical protein